LSKSQSQRVVRKLVENTRPIKVKVIRGSRGVRYEVTVSGRDVEDALALLQQAEEKLHARYGLHAEQSPRTENIVEREFPLARNGMVYGTVSLSSGGVRITPAGVKIYTTDGPVGWLIKKFLPSFTKNAKIKVEEQNGEIQSIEIRDWKPDMRSLNELAERAAWSFSTAATKPPKQQQPKPQQPEKKEGEKQ